MKCPIEYTKQEILQGMQTGGSALTQIIDSIIETLCNCQAFVGTVFRHVKNNRGNEQDAEDLLQDALTQLAITLMGRKYEGNSSIENFAFGICKNKWLNKITKKSFNREKMVEEDPRKNVAAEHSTDQPLLEKERNSLLWEIVNQLSGKCPDYLTYWAQGYSHKEVATLMGVSERRSLNATAECRKKLRDLIGNHPNFEELVISDY